MYLYYNNIINIIIFKLYNMYNIYILCCANTITQIIYNTMPAIIIIYHVYTVATYILYLS